MKRRCLALIMGVLLLTAGPASAAQTGFADINGHWAQEAILDITGRGIMNGVGVNGEGLSLFAPEMQVSRAQAAAVLVGAFQLDLGSKVFVKQPLASDYYRDVDDRSWYADAALKCALNQIFSDSDHFYPDQSITRLEMARAIQQCFQAKGIILPSFRVTTDYKDTENLSPAEANAVSFVTTYAIMGGADHYFRPRDTMTRAELAQILESSLQNFNREAAVDESDNGKEFSINSGRSFSLSLDSNATTGYEWQLSDSYDQNILKLSNSYYQASSSTDTTLVGQGGKQYWQFTALQAGTTELKLTYSRPWESVQPLQTFTVKISVSSASAQESALTFTTRALKNETRDMIVDMQVPVLSGLKNTTVQDALNSRWADDADSFVKSVGSTLEEYIKEREEMNAPLNPYGATSRYTMCRSDDNFLSMYIDYYQYTGGAHGGTERRAYNIDLQTGKTLALSDLFKTGFDYATVINQAIQKQIDADPETYFSGQEGFTGITPEQGYYIQDQNLVVYFQQYEIAAYAMGLPEFQIPLSQLQDGLTVSF